MTLADLLSPTPFPEDDTYDTTGTPRPRTYCWDGLCGRPECSRCGEEATE